ncbi:hypothetical protein FHK07_12080 [Listeria monocytogenes]|nr:hypothetical protein [Listeria monocytogenes]EJM6842213.1 hypothetical protein [Listeria monocytogenes]
MQKQTIILNEANKKIHRKGTELANAAVSNSKDLQRFAMGLEKLSQDIWDYKHEMDQLDISNKLKGGN